VKPVAEADYAAALEQNFDAAAFCERASRASWVTAPDFSAAALIAAIRCRIDGIAPALRSRSRRRSVMPLILWFKGASWLTAYWSLAISSVRLVKGIASYGVAALARAEMELGQLAGKSWEEINNHLPKSIGVTAALVPPVALVGLAVWLTDPVTGVAVTVAAFKPMANILKSFGRNKKPAKAKKKPRKT
jgi:hypothetical protein